MGADGASPSKGFRRALPRRVRDKTGGMTSVSSDSRGAKPRPHPSDKAALARGKNGRRRSIALQVFAGRSRAAFVVYWRDDRRVVRFMRGEAPPHSDQQGPRLRAGNDGADGAAPSMAFGSVSPNQRIHFSVVWPICGSCHQTGPHRVFDHIPPLFVVAFLSSQLGLPEIALPDWRVLRLWPMSRGMGFPIRNPLLKRW